MCHTFVTFIVVIDYLQLYKNILSTYYTPNILSGGYINIVFVTLFVHVSLLLSTFMSSFALILLFSLGGGTGRGYMLGPADLL